MPTPALLACDWGTTNLRAWALDSEGRVLARREFPCGVSRLQPGDAPRLFAEDVRSGLAAPDAPAILCGMVGSNLGWTLAPYIDCPADLAALAAKVVAAPGAGPPVRIVPGVRGPGFNGRGDVMRGEETQLFGWLAADPGRARGRRLVCHPGTHTKWMRVEDGRLTAFVTAMTGELFAVLSQHSILRGDPGVRDLAAFDEGVAAAEGGDALAARLFTARARVIAQGAPAHGALSYLSGLLIGADVAATPRLLASGAADKGIVLIGDSELCALYGRALGLAGVEVEAFDGESAAVAGLFALHSREAVP
jgi:2-dehydro-3-deoxygalactonokinase